MDYRAVFTSSRHRRFCFHNFVFLLNCIIVLYNAHRISVCVIAVSKSHEFLLKVRRLSSFFRRRVVIFSTTTQGIPLRRRVDVFSTTSDRSGYCYGYVRCDPGVGQTPNEEMTDRMGDYIPWTSPTSVN